MMSNHKKILFPVDGSAHSDRAFEWFLTNFRNVDDEMIFLHVHQYLENVNQRTDRSEDEESECSQDDLFEIQQAAEKKSSPIMDKFAKKCIDYKVPFRTIVSFGQPGKIICKTAVDENVTCIVMGNRGLGVFRRSVLGSVSDSVIHKSSIPVLLVPPT